MSETELYALAAKRHDWVHRYLRLVLTRHTEIRLLPEREQDALLGNALDGRDVAAIGAGGATREERAWRAYNQLREVAFLRNDSFPVPVVCALADGATAITSTTAPSSVKKTSGSLRTGAFDSFAGRTGSREHR